MFEQGSYDWLPCVPGSSAPRRVCNTFNASSSSNILFRSYERGSVHLQLMNTSKRLFAAIQALSTMINASDFDRKMLMLAMNLARQLENQSLLHAILERLLETLRKDGDVDEAVQRFTLIRYVSLHCLSRCLMFGRCLVRLTLSLMELPSAETYVRSRVLFRRSTAIARD